MKATKKVLYSLMGVILTLGGCAFIDQSLRVAPEINVAGSDIGKGRSVGLKVVDDRDDTTIGRRGSAYGPAAKISTDQNLAVILEDLVSRGLQRQGFNVVKGQASPVVLHVALRTLSYEATIGMWTGGNVGKTVIKVIGTNGNSNFEKTYRSQKEIRTAFVGSQETNSKVINGALGEALSKIFQDKELIAFLTM